MNMMNEMMAKMDGDMKKQATEMMGKCNEMMAKAPPEQKKQWMGMMERCQGMMGDSDQEASSEDVEQGNLVFTHKASGSFEDVENCVEDDAKAIGLGLKKVFPFSKNLPEQQGFEVNEAASVYELCMPSLAAELLNAQPELNVLMPCRVSVYEKKGEVFVSIPNLTVQLDALGAEGALKDNILELYGRMVEMIQRW